MSNAIQLDVETLVQKELESANKKFPQFHSPHEGYAVLLEEVEESEEQLAAVKEILVCLWGGIKANVPPDRISMYLNIIKAHSENLACGSIQIAAMAQKFLDMLESDT